MKAGHCEAKEIRNAANGEGLSDVADAHISRCGACRDVLNTANAATHVPSLKKIAEFLIAAIEAQEKETGFQWTDSQQHPGHGRTGKK